MAEKEEYTHNLYQGGASTLDPEKGEYFTGYRSGGGSVGIASDFRTANIIKDSSQRLSSGTKHIELALVSPEIFDSIPSQQLTEMKRLSKLVGSTVSVHGPVSGTDASGFTQHGWSESSREANERKIIQALNRSHQVDPDGNVVVTFHTTEGVQGTEWEQIPDSAKGDKGKAQKLVIVDRDKGQPQAIEKDVKYYPGGEVRKEEYSPEKNLEIINHTQWDNEISQVEINREAAERIMHDSHPVLRGLYLDWKKSQLEGKPMERDVSQEEMDQLKKLYSADEYVQQASLKMNGLFTKAYECALKDEDKQMLNHLTKVSKAYGKILGMNEKGERSTKSLDPKTQSEALFFLEQNLRQIRPRQFIPIEEFALEKSSQTFGNAAFEGFKKFGNTAPIVSIENPPTGFGMSTGEDLRNIVQESQKQFVKRAVEEKGMSEAEAKELADKFIGATWDVGHINMIRGKGHSEQDVVKETEKVAPFVKHVHLSDNFGFEHTELPMGMGNVPMKEIMEKLGEKGFEAKKVIEAGQWWQHFSEQGAHSAFVPTMEGLGSPMYSEGVGPYWNQSLGFQQGYMGGLDGAWLPSNHYETFGTTFARLPKELGGNLQQGAGGRMGGGRE